MGVFEGIHQRKPSATEFTNTMALLSISKEGKAPIDSLHFLKKKKSYNKPKVQETILQKAYKNTQLVEARSEKESKTHAWIIDTQALAPADSRRFSDQLFKFPLMLWYIWSDSLLENNFNLKGLKIKGTHTNVFMRLRLKSSASLCI